MVLDINSIKKLVINLPERVDRKDHVINQLNKFFWDFEFVNGIKKQIPSEGIAGAHINCIKLAKEQNLPYICIIEDDVVFRDGAKEYFNEIFNNVPDDFDVLLSGYYTGSLLKRGKYWDSIGQFCGLHFYIVAAKFYDYILNFHFKGHIDRYMNETEHNKIYCSNKFFATQLDGWSDNVKKNVTYSQTLNKKQLL